MNDLVKNIDEIINNLQTFYDGQENPDSSLVLQLDGLYKLKLNLIKINISSDTKKYKDIQDALSKAVKTTRDAIADCNKEVDVILKITKSTETIIKVLTEIL